MDHQNPARTLAQIEELFEQRRIRILYYSYCWQLLGTIAIRYIAEGARNSEIGLRNGDKA